MANLMDVNDIDFNYRSRRRNYLLFNVLFATSTDSLWVIIMMNIEFNNYS